MKLVILESPFAAPTQRGIDANVAYAQRALRDCLMRGEAPIASHLLYTQPGVLDDTLPAERALGIEAGLLWGRFAELTVVYVDRGISKGMRMGIERAENEGRPVVYRFFEPAEYVPQPTIVPKKLGYVDVRLDIPNFETTLPRTLRFPKIPKL